MIEAMQSPQAYSIRRSVCSQLPHRYIILDPCTKENWNFIRFLNAAVPRLSVFIF